MKEDEEPKEEKSLPMWYDPRTFEDKKNDDDDEDEDPPS